MSEFKPGEKVVSEFSNVEYTIVAGPHGFHDGAYYLVRSPENGATVILASVLKPIPPADPRQQVVATALMAWDWELSGDNAADAAVKVLSALDAMPKPEPKRVKDDSGDIWEEGANGLWSCVGEEWYVGDGHQCWTWDKLKSNYVNLTPLND